MYSKKNKWKPKQNGMTLIEVLVSMLIIGLALAMSISMIQTANRFGESAEFSSSALRQAQNIIDKIRANKAAADKYEFLGGLTLKATDTFSDLYKVDMAKIPTCSASCTPAEKVASEDLQQWRANLAELLPGGKGIIRRINDRRFDIVVMWHYNLEYAELKDDSDAQGVRLDFAL